MEKKSLLDKIDTKEINNEKSPFSNKRKKSRPVQVREYQYEKLREKAFKENKKLVDIVEDIFNEYFSNHN
ncbi:hypothetical protein [Enterococcus sp. AZ103]|uniref:hypothetical protein n=1 Tax=Enterococcus sp. AZ103 TaxID=2774628 RepID=UPI003F1F8FF3